MIPRRSHQAIFYVVADDIIVVSAKIWLSDVAFDKIIEWYIHTPIGVQYDTMIIHMQGPFQGSSISYKLFAVGFVRPTVGLISR